MTSPPHEPTEPQPQPYGPQPPVDPYAGQTQRMPAYPPPGQQGPPAQQVPGAGYPPPQWRSGQQVPTGYPPPGQQPLPQRPPTPGSATQAAALQNGIALSSARGWRLEGTSPGVATMVSGHKPNHVLHLLLTLFTCGLWAVAWIIVAATVTEKRLTIVADLDGNITYPRGAYLPPQAAPGPYPQGAYPPPQQPKQPAVTTGGWVAIGGGVLAVVVLLAVAAGGGFSSSTQLADQSRNNNRPYDPPTPSDTGTTPASAAAPTTVPPPTTAAATTKPATNTGAPAISAWFNGGGSQRLQALSNDFNAFHDAGTKGDIAAVSAAARAACVTLQKDVEAAQAYKPIPDGPAQKSWAAALASYARAATDCIAGVDTTSADLINRTNDEMTAGNSDLDKVTARMRELATH